MAFPENNKIALSEMIKPIEYLDEKFDTWLRTHPYFYETGGITIVSTGSGTNKLYFMEGEDILFIPKESFSKDKIETSTIEIVPGCKERIERGLFRCVNTYLNGGKVYSPDVEMALAAERNDWKTVMHCINEEGATNWNRGLIHAARGGHLPMVSFFWGKGADDWEEAMIYATVAGFKDLVDFAINQGANEWERGMTWAAKGGHWDLVMFFVEKGAHDWKWGMGYAAKGEHWDLVMFFIEKGANAWNFGMINATEGGHWDLVMFFVEKGANAWKSAMKYAMKGGHKELVKFFEEKMSAENELELDFE